MHTLGIHKSRAKLYGGPSLSSVPIPDPLKAELTALPRALRTENVFICRGRPLRDIRDGVKRAFMYGGIQYGSKTPGGFTFHDLRHTFTTNMRRSGVPESVIMAMTGHSACEMFDRYNRIDGRDMQDAAERLTGFCNQGLPANLVATSHLKM